MIRRGKGKKGPPSLSPGEGRAGGKTMPGGKAEGQRTPPGCS
jgi:hypothetical protein